MLSLYVIAVLSIIRHLDCYTKGVVLFVKYVLKIKERKKLNKPVLRDMV